MRHDFITWQIIIGSSLNLYLVLLCTIRVYINNWELSTLYRYVPNTHSGLDLAE